MTDVVLLVYHTTSRLCSLQIKTARSFGVTSTKITVDAFFFFWYCHWIARILSVLLSMQGLNLSHCSTFTSARLLNNSSLCVFWAQFLNVSPAFVNSFQPQNVVETPEDAPCDRGKDKQTNSDDTSMDTFQFYSVTVHSGRNVVGYLHSDRTYHKYSEIKSIHKTLKGEKIYTKWGKQVIERKRKTNTFIFRTETADNSLGVCLFYFHYLSLFAWRWLF